MKKTPYVVIVLLVVVVVVLSLGTCRRITQGNDPPPTEWRDTIYDTIPYYFPVPRDSIVLRYESITIPVRRDSTVLDTMVTEVQVICQDDSAVVNIPITQKVYEDSTYRAYVSGYHPSLDSIFIYRSTEIVNIRSPTKTKRFSFGLQGGYGMTPKGFQPYIGIGGTLIIFSF